MAAAAAHAVKASRKVHKEAKEGPGEAGQRLVNGNGWSKAAHAAAHAVKPVQGEVRVCLSTEAQDIFRVASSGGILPFSIQE
jgi:hypothetical protein